MNTAGHHATPDLNGLYVGRVTHLRRRPRRHRLSYSVFMLALDLDRPQVPGLRLFRHNRPGVLSLRDRDHGPKTGPMRDLIRQGGLRAWITAELAAIGQPSPASIQMLTMPRLWGYVFNPLTVYFCRDPAGDLTTIVHEVHNTFGERHAYVLPVTGSEQPEGAAGPEGTVCQQTAKTFRVSPFIPVHGHYDFRIGAPDRHVAVHIDYRPGDGTADTDARPLLSAGFLGHRRPLSDTALARAVLTHPLMTVKVIAGIHWEALRLFLKGVRPGHARRPDQPPTRPRAAAVGLSNAKPGETGS